MNLIFGTTIWHNNYGHFQCSIWIQIQRHNNDEEKRNNDVAVHPFQKQHLETACLKWQIPQTSPSLNSRRYRPWQHSQCLSRHGISASVICWPQMTPFHAWPSQLLLRLILSLSFPVLHRGALLLTQGACLASRSQVSVSRVLWLLLLLTKMNCAPVNGLIWWRFQWNPTSLFCIRPVSLPVAVAISILVLTQRQKRHLFVNKPYQPKHSFFLLSISSLIWLWTPFCGSDRLRMGCVKRHPNPASGASAWWEQ